MLIGGYKTTATVFLKFKSFDFLVWKNQWTCIKSFFNAFTPRPIYDWMISHYNFQIWGQNQNPMV